MEIITDVFLSIGSNLGDRLNYLQKAINALSEQVGSVVAVSPVYESEPLGFDSENNFFNACVQVQTSLSPHEVLSNIHHIEHELGRIRDDNGQYCSRTLDIDIVLFGQKVMTDRDLKIPHPLYTKRLFVLLPLRDLDAHLSDPLTGIAISELLKTCTDTSEITLSEHKLLI